MSFLMLPLERLVEVEVSLSVSVPEDESDWEPQQLELRELERWSEPPLPWVEELVSEDDPLKVPLSPEILESNVI
jgi:hypothetical protein